MSLICFSINHTNNEGLSKLPCSFQKILFNLQQLIQGNLLKAETQPQHATNEDTPTDEDSATNGKRNSMPREHMLLLLFLNKPSHKQLLVVKVSSMIKCFKNGVILACS